MNQKKYTILNNKYLDIKKKTTVALKIKRKNRKCYFLKRMN